MANIKDFLLDIDSNWSGSGSPRIPLKIIGSAALMLQAKYDRGTKDSDVLETEDLTPTIKEKLLNLAGPNTGLAKRWRLYIDIVQPGIPFLPQGPKYHFLSSLNRSLKHFEVAVLDITDVTVSKFKRFNANDASDVAEMIRLGLVEHKLLVKRFESAVDMYSMDARAEDLPRYIRNLNTAERDYFMVPESQIEVPYF